MPSAAPDLCRYSNLWNLTAADHRTLPSRREDKHKILNVLSQLLVSSPVLTAPIAQLFRPILLELVARVTDSGPRSVLGEWEMQRFEATASALSKLLHMVPHTSGMVLAFFARSPSLRTRMSQPRAADSTHVDVRRSVHLLSL